MVNKRLYCHSFLDCHQLFEWLLERNEIESLPTHHTTAFRNITYLEKNIKEPAQELRPCRLCSGTKSSIPFTHQRISI